MNELLKQRKKVKRWIKDQIRAGLTGYQIIQKALNLSPELHQSVLYELQDPAFTLRPKQELPDMESDWYIWFLRTARNFGKNHAASAGLNEFARYHFPGQLGLIVAATHKDFWSTIYSGPSGLKALAPPDFQPEYRERHLEVVWPNGSKAAVRTGDNPQDIRGLSVSWAYADELIKWPKGEVSWQNIQNCVREGERPRIILTSTPLRGAEWLKKVEELPDTVVTRGSSRENTATSEVFFRNQAHNLGVGSKSYQEEAEGEWVEDSGFLWTRAQVEAITVTNAGTTLKQFAATMDERLLSIDPGGARDETGIILLGRKGDDYWVLLDESLQAKSSAWFPIVQHIWQEFMQPFDRIVVETNAHRDIEQHLTAFDPRLYVEGVQQTTATGSKAARAEAAQVFYDQGRVRHFAPFPQLASQMVDFYAILESRDKSPDRVDALCTGLLKLSEAGVQIVNIFQLPLSGGF